MTLTQLRIMAYATIPGLKQKVVDDTTVDLYINKGVIDVSAYTVCLKTNKKFAVVADQAKYNLSSVIGDYLTMDKPGLWWNSGTVALPNYKPLNPVTLKSLDNDRPNWRNLASGTPQDYSIDGDILTLVPAPETSLADGFLLYYGKKPIAMTNAAHYPFSGSTIEYSHLSIFDDAIILYVRSKLNPTMNKLNDENLTLKEYYSELESKLKVFKKRPDIRANADTKFMAPRVRG